MRRAHIAENLGDIMLFGQSFHELFVRGVIEKGIAPQFEGAPLSGRERQCLQMAAHGMTGAEIGFKLGISERTVTFHFANIIEQARRAQSPGGDREEHRAGRDPDGGS